MNRSPSARPVCILHQWCSGLTLSAKWSQVVRYIKTTYNNQAFPAEDLLSRGLSKNRAVEGDPGTCEPQDATQQTRCEEI